MTKEECIQVGEKLICTTCKCDEEKCECEIFTREWRQE